MSHLRACLRLLAFVTWSVAAGCARAASGALMAVWPRAGAHACDVVGRTWARGVAAIVGLSIAVEGAPPRPPFFLVSNHLGYVDVITLMAHAPGVFVAKAEVARWPLLGWMARQADTIFVDRAAARDVLRVNAVILGVLDRGRGVLVFPEGTSSSGEAVLPFRSSLLEPAAKIGHPVVYATLGYGVPRGSPPAARSVCWWGDMTFFNHFYGLLRLPRISARLVFGSAPVRATDRRELAETLWRAVAAQLAPASRAEARWA